MDFYTCNNYHAGKVSSTYFDGGKSMNAFRILLIIFIIAIVGFTGIVIFNHGWNLLPIFFGDMAAMTWPGQFNLDFLCLLTLSGIWIAWRHHFSLGGLALGVLGLFGGIMILAPYLLLASYKANGDVKVLLLGRDRADN